MFGKKSLHKFKEYGTNKVDSILEMGPNRKNHMDDKFFRDFFEELPYEIYYIDIDFKVLWTNKFGRKKNGREIRHGKYCYEVNECKNGELMCTPCPAARALKSRKNEVEIFEVERPETKTLNAQKGLYLEKTAIPMLDDNSNMLGVFILTMDVTEKQLFAKLKDNYFKTTRGDRVEENKAMYSETDLINSMSYEMRTSLSGISSMAQLLESSELSREQFDWLESLRVSTKRLKGVLDNIMNISKYGNDEIVVKEETFTLLKVIKQYQINFEKEINDKKVKIVYKYDSRIPKNLLGDKEKIVKIIDGLVNYIYNRISRGKIIIKTELIRNEKKVSKIKISVVNMAIWVGNVEFSSKTDFGLTISKNYIEALEGTYDINNINNEGTCIDIELKIKRDNSSTKDMADKSFWNREVFKKKEKLVESKKKILIVEDETIGRITLEHMLKKKYDLVFAKDGKEAVGVYFKESPDLVIMDIMMPEMNGFEAYDEIDRNTMKRAPIIACTAKVISSEREYLTSYGFDDYIPKPVDLKLLLMTIDKYLAKKK